MTTLRAVLFDVDFTLCRPGPELSPERYARIAKRHGVELDLSRYEEARETAALNLKRHPELLHDDSVWHAFTMDVFIGMGGPRAVASECSKMNRSSWVVSSLRKAARRASATCSRAISRRIRGSRNGR